MPIKTGWLTPGHGEWAARKKIGCVPVSNYCPRLKRPVMGGLLYMGLGRDTREKGSRLGLGLHVGGTWMMVQVRVLGMPVWGVNQELAMQRKLREKAFIGSISCSRPKQNARSYLRKLWGGSMKRLLLGYKICKEHHDIEASVQEGERRDVGEVNKERRS